RVQRQAPALAEGGQPVALPGPGQERRAEPRVGMQRLPGLGAHRLQAFVDVGLHGGQRSDAPAASTDSVPSPPAAGPSPVSPSAMASSTADSKSSPSSSPNSLPIFFMNRATLAGSLSSTSPNEPVSARDSRRASSLLTVAKRDIRRVNAVPPQRGHAGVAAFEIVRISRLTRRRQSAHSYS